MSELLKLEQGAYVAPEGLQDYADRDIDSKTLVLYIGDKALLDIVEKGFVDESMQVAVPDRLIKRVVASKEEAMDLFVHPQKFMPRIDALRIFDPTNRELVMLESQMSEAA